MLVIVITTEVLVGLLAIFVTHTRNYYKEYQHDMCSKFTAFWCKLFSHKRKHARPNEVDNPGLDVSSVDVEGGNDAFCGGLRTGVPIWEEQLQQAELAAIEADVDRANLILQMDKETK